MRPDHKEMILVLVVLITAGIVGVLSLNYIIKSGDCQLKAKAEGTYNEDTPFKCLYLKQK